MIRIRQQTPADIELGMRLKSAAGWNQLPADWQRFQVMQPDGCFVAELEGAPVGTAVAVIFDQVAWLAMVLVDPQFRGRGIGQALLTHALEFVDAHSAMSVRLDATPLGQPLYERLGFLPQYALTRYAGRLPAADPAISFPTATPDLARWTNDIMALDKAVVGADRGKFLTRLLEKHPRSLHLAHQHGQLQGFLLSRPGSQAVQIGPCIAHADAGEWLLNEACREHAGALVFVDVPVPCPLAARIADKMSLLPQRQLLRMCRGQPVNDDPLRLWASSGPELG